MSPKPNQHASTSHTTSGRQPLPNLDNLKAKPDASVLVCAPQDITAAITLMPDWIVTTIVLDGSVQPDCTPLAGKKVGIWFANDKASQSLAKQVMAKINEEAPSAEVMLLPPFTVRPVYDGASNPVLAPGFIEPPGWSARTALAAGWTAAHMSLLLTPVPPAGSAMPESSPPPKSTIHELYRVDDTGVYKRKAMADKSDPGIWLSSRIDVVAWAQDTDDGSWHLRLSMLNLDGAQLEWLLPRQKFAGSATAIVGEALKRGGHVSSNASSKLDWLDYLQTCQPSARVAIVRKTGWHARAFVLSDGSVYGPSHGVINLQGVTEDRRAAFAPAGTLAQWQAHVATPCAGNSRLTLALCVSFCGPVLALLNEESGGFHFVGPSSMGKSTALAVSCSVWAAPSRLMGTWLSTANGIEGTAKLHNDMLMPIDEIGQGDANHLGQVIYMLGNGMGKARADCVGRLRPPVTYNVMVLSTGEHTVEASMSSVGQTIKAGQQSRLVDVLADPGAGMGIVEALNGFDTSGAFIAAIDQHCTQYHGTAARAWLEVLADPLRQAQVLTEIRAQIAVFMEAHMPTDATGFVQRVCRRFALAAAVGEVCIRHRVLPWQEGEAKEGVGACWDAWLQGRLVTPGAFDGNQAIEQVHQYLAQYGDTHFTEMRPRGLDAEGAAASGVPLAERHGFKGQLADGRWEYFIWPSVFTNTVCVAMNPRLVTKALINSGYLRKGVDGKNQVSRNFPGVGQARAYHISVTEPLAPASGGGQA